MEIKIDENDIQDLKTCKKCNKRLSNYQLGMIFLSAYLLLSSLYGTYMFVHILIQLFK
jgi:hypothetical protein